MILRDLSVLLLSLLFSGASLAGVTRAFDWRKPVWERGCCIEPRYDPIFMVYPVDAPRLSRSCPRSEPIDWSASLLSERGDAPPPGLAAARFSPGFCVEIGANGRARAVHLAESSGDAALDQALIRDIRRAHFVAAQRNGRPVTAWQRVVIRLPGRPSALPTIRQRGPEVALTHYLSDRWP